MKQAAKVCAALGVTYDEIKNAMIEADGGSGADYISMAVKVPKIGRRFPPDPSSILSKTAALLEIDVEALRDAILASRDKPQPGETIRFAVRVRAPMPAVTKAQRAQLAADTGDYWAGEWLKIHRALRRVAQMD